MPQSDEIKQYINSVCEQIRWKTAHNIISEEIENHIADQKDAFMSEGVDEATAITQAIEEMGDPVIVGAQFDRTHRPKTEWSMIILTVSLLLLGQVVTYFIEATFLGGILASRSVTLLFNKSVWAVIFGSVCMIAAYFIDFTIIGKYLERIFAGLCGFTLAFLTSARIHNGRIVSYDMPYLFSSSSAFNITLLTLPFAVAYTGVILSKRSKGYKGLLLCGVYYAFPAAIFWFAGHSLVSVFFYTLMCFLLLVYSICMGFFNINRLYGMLMVSVPAVVVCALSALIMPDVRYRLAHLGVLLNPSTDTTGSGYSLLMTREILSCSKFIGQGTAPPSFIAGGFNLYLPETFMNYPITYLIHRVGWVSLIVIVILLLAFIARGFYLCVKQKSVLGRLVSTAVMLVFSIQIPPFILVNLGLLISSPFCLPFISYGRTSTVINLFLVGLMLSVFKSGDLAWDKQKERSVPPMKDISKGLSG